MRNIKPQPICKCGCGRPVTERYQNGIGGWKRYIDGHKSAKLQQRDSAAAKTRKALRSSARSEAPAKANGRANGHALTSAAPVDLLGRLGKIKQDLQRYLDAITTVELLLRDGALPHATEAIASLSSLR